MTEQTKTVLKTYFNTGDFPTESNFADLIDSFMGLAETGSQTVGGAVTFSAATTFGSTVSVSAAAAFGSTVSVSAKLTGAAAAFSGKVSADGGLNTTTVSSNSLFASNIIVSGATIHGVLGTSTILASVSGTPTSGNIATWDGAGNLQDGGVVATAASQADMEAASSTTVFVSPGRAKYHPNMPKAWCLFDGTSSSPTVIVGAGISSITKNGTGDYTVTFSTNFSSANYAMFGTASGNSTFTRVVYIAEDHAPTVSTCRFYTGTTSSGVGVDCKYVSVAFFGDQ